MINLPKNYLYEYKDRSIFKRYSGIIGSLYDSNPDSLFIARHNQFLRTGILNEKQPDKTEQHMANWSHTAISIIQQVWKQSGCSEHAIACFALGKLGSLELNLSSDVDLLIIADPISNSHSNSFKQFATSLSSVNEYGFLFRVDFDLRPGGKHSPIVQNTDQLINYYWRFGETWERLAFIRLLPVCGDASVINDVCDFANRFSYRKFVDYSLYESLIDLRTKYHVPDQNSINLKLSPGGIRDIELLVHTLLSIFGGKNPKIKTRSTTRAIENLKNIGQLNAKEGEFLKQSYLKLRNLENSVQFIADLQTHTYNEHLGLIPIEELRKIMTHVDEIVSNRLGKSIEKSTEKGLWLKKFKNIDPVELSTWKKILDQPLISKKTSKDEKYRNEVLKLFAQKFYLNKSRNFLALSRLEDFIYSIKSKSSMYQLLHREPSLIQKLSQVFIHSAFVSQIVTKRPEVIDSVLLNRIEAIKHIEVDDTQKRIDHKLIANVIASLEFLDKKNVTELIENQSQLADNLCTDLLEKLKIQFANDSLEILTLGKWGTFELGIKSDLDFIFVSQNQPCESDFKVAKRFISRLTEQSLGGALYEVDLRLRPNGNSGPLITSKKSLVSYFNSKAKAWEKQAYLRARPLNPNSKDIVPKITYDNTEVAELIDIRKKLLNKSSNIDLKYSTGALIDIEFTAQISALKNAHPPIGYSTLDLVNWLAESDNKWKQNKDTISEVYLYLRMIEQLLHLVTSQSGSKLSTLNLEKISEVIGGSPNEIEQKILNALQKSKYALEQIDSMERNQ